MVNRDPERIICPHCGQAVLDKEALLCLFCGNSLNRVSSGGVFGAMHGANGSSAWIILPIIGFIILLIVALSMAGF